MFYETTRNTTDPAIQADPCIVGTAKHPRGLHDRFDVGGGRLAVRLPDAYLSVQHGYLVPLRLERHARSSTVPSKTGSATALESGARIQASRPVSTRSAWTTQEASPRDTHSALASHFSRNMLLRAGSRANDATRPPIPVGFRPRNSVARCKFRHSVVCRSSGSAG